MSVDANALERETLERKDRDELQKIVGALGGKATTRTRKADLIDQILELTGVTAQDGEAASDAPGDSSTSADGKATAEAGADKADTTDEKTADEKTADKGPAEKAEKAEKTEKVEKADDDAEDDAGEADKDQDAAEAKKDQDQDRGKDQGEDAAKDADGGADQKTDGEGGKRRRRRGRSRDTGGAPEEYSGEPIPVEGVLDLRDDGYGFLRVAGMLPSKDDCYVSVKQVRQFGLRKGDKIVGGSRPAFRNEKNPAIMRIDTVNDVAIEPDTERPLFEHLTPVFPTERLDLALDHDEDVVMSRVLDLLAPIGKGSRVLVAAPPRSGKTRLLRTLARAVEANEPDVALSVVLVDERPEEISEMEALVTGGEVHGTSYDRSADEHVASVELAMARARRRAEAGDDVVVLIDGLTRLARAQHAAGPNAGPSLGGLHVGAIETAKRALGAGRALEGAGTLTVVAAADAGTGSPVDDAVLDAVGNAANVHITLDGAAARRGVFPAVDVDDTRTLRADLLVGDEGAAARQALRDVIAELPEGDVAEQAGPLDRLLRRLRKTDSNEQILADAVKERKR